MPADRPKTRLGEILKDEGRTQTWLSSQIGRDKSQVNRWVQGLHVPEDIRIEIAVALGRKTSDVFPEQVAA